MSKDMHSKRKMKKSKEQITKGGQRRPFSIKDFGFIGSGESRKGALMPVSVRHDEVLAEAFRK